MLAIGIISVLLGVAMIIWPEEAQKYFALAIGIAFLAAGILNISIVSAYNIVKQIGADQKQLRVL